MRPWESLSLHYLQPHVAAPSTDRATDDELQLLTACRDRRLGAWVTQQNRVRPLVLDVQRNGDRVELRTPRGLTIRLDGLHAAFAHRDWGMVELGPYAESARRTFDSLLPWLPHRSDRELASMFQIASLDLPDLKAGEFALQLVPEVLGDSGHNVMVWIIDRESGALQRIQWRQDEKLLMELTWRVSSPAAPAAWELRRGTDTDQPSLRWMSLAQSPAVLKQLGRTAQPVAEIPPLDAAWPGLLVIDRRTDAETKAVPPSLLDEWHRACKAKRYSEAKTLIEQAIKRQGPLAPLLFFRAYSQAKMSDKGQNAAVEADLRKLVSLPSTRWLHLITSENFPQFDEEKIYELVSSRPAAIRTADDEELLARLALRIMNGEQAWKHCQVMMKLDDASMIKFQRLFFALSLATANKDYALAGTWALRAKHPGINLSDLTRLSSFIYQNQGKEVVRDLMLHRAAQNLRRQIDEPELCYLIAMRTDDPLDRCRWLLRGMK
ncbi:MAG: hypothetical protein ACKOU6_18290, partial [Planctomycetota bacterium]